MADWFVGLEGQWWMVEDQTEARIETSLAVLRTARQTSFPPLLHIRVFVVVFTIQNIYSNV